MREGCLIKCDHSLSHYQSPILREHGKEHVSSGVSGRRDGEHPSCPRGGRRGQEEGTGEYQHLQTEGVGLGRRQVPVGTSTHTPPRMHAQAHTCTHTRTRRIPPTRSLGQPLSAGPFSIPARTVGPFPPRGAAIELSEHERARDSQQNPTQKSRPRTSHEGSRCNRRHPGCAPDSATALLYNVKLIKFKKIT